MNVWGVRPEGKTDEAIAQEGLEAMEASVRQQEAELGAA